MQLRISASLKKTYAKNICMMILIIFLFDSVFHISRMMFGGTYIGRIILLSIMLFLTVSKLIVNKKIRLNRIDISLLVFTFLLLFAYTKSALIGGDMQYASTYIINGFIYLLFLPIMYYCIDSVGKCEQLMKYVAFIGTIVSIIAILLGVFNKIFPAWYYSVAQILNDMEMVSILAQTDNTVRIMLSGMVFQIMGLYVGIYYYIKKSHGLFWIIVAAINFFGVILTYARGLIIGTIIAFLFWILLTLKYNRLDKNRANIIIGLAIVGVIIVLIYILCGNLGNVISYLLNRFLGTSNDDTVGSDIFRDNMSIMINNKIMEAPIMGSGLGAHINLRDGAIEMTFQDIVIRTGFTGLIVFLYPFFYMFSKVFRKHELSLLRGIVFCMLVAVMFASYFNPYLVNSLGIFLYCFCIRVFSLTSN